MESSWIVLSGKPRRKASSGVSTDTRFVLNVFLHAADISSPILQFISDIWSRRVLEEFRAVSAAGYELKSLICSFEWTSEKST